MSLDWWPRHLAHIPGERPWDEANIKVAEIKSFDERPHAGHRRTFSVLVPMAQLDHVANNLWKLDTDVSTSGPHPSPLPSSTYQPKFWISGRELPSEQYEPLVLSWSSHEKTVLLPDPGFLMTYGLVPRNGKDGLVHWDDPATPMHDVVIVSAPSVWDFPLATHAYVSIAKDHLEDYLTLRGMALVQVFWEERWGKTDPAMDKELGKEEVVEVRFPDRLFQLNRYLEDKTVVAAQVWGGRVVATAGKLPISDNPLETEGLNWPGFREPVTDDMAMRMGQTDHVYVNDAVLGAFEGRPGFQIHPESGSVTFGTQWSVGFCERVGRNLIRLELKKLYEGVRPYITRHWNAFAVPPLPDSAYPAILRERHIAIRAKDITFAMVSLGEALQSLAESVGLRGLGDEDFVSLRRSELEYRGWWSVEASEAISRHVPLDLPMDAFLDRAMRMNKLLVEGLDERSFRRLLHAIGVPADAIKELSTMKLLDCIVRMAQVAIKTGLHLSKDGGLIWTRLLKEGVEPAQPVAYLFALYDIRIIASHKSTKSHEKLMSALARFGVGHDEEKAGYGRILDTVYDALALQLQESASKIKAAT